MSGRPDGESLARVAQVWASEQTGAFRSHTLSGRAIVVQGEPRDGQARVWLDKAIREGPVQFTPVTTFGHTPHLTIAGMLWGLACELASTSSLQRNRHGLLVDGVAARGMMRLPLSEPVRKLLEIRSDPSEDLENLLRRSEVDREAVWFELAALITLGALKLRFPAAAKPYAETPSPAPAGRAPSKPPPPPTPLPPPPPPPPPTESSSPGREKIADGELEKQAMIQKRLQREWAVIEEANDHVVLGITPQMNEETRASACNRMEQRYRKLAEDEGLNDLSRELAQNILARVQVAIERVEQGKASSFVGDPFEQGKVAAAQGDWETALKLFALARSKSDNPVYRAWFGWALYNDPSRPVETRRAKGREHMDLADNISTNSDAAFLLARADIVEGELVRAWNRLELLVNARPDYVEARHLLTQVQKDVRKD